MIGSPAIGLGCSNARDPSGIGRRKPEHNTPSICPVLQMSFASTESFLNFYYRRLQATSNGGSYMPDATSADENCHFRTIGEN